MRRQVARSASLALLAAACSTAGCSALTAFGDLVFDDGRDAGDRDTSPIDMGSTADTGRDAGDAGTRDASDARVSGDAGDAGDSGAIDAGDSGPRDAGGCTRDEDCASADPCSVGTCRGGECVGTMALDTTPCDDENECTDDDACLDGTCVGTESTCAPIDDCHVGVCDARDGSCVQMRAPEGTACDDGDGCTEASTCTATGTCVGTRCIEDDPCRISACNTDTEVCALMADTDGRPCDGGICCAGACVDTSTDARNCSACGISCDEMSGASCIDGHCASCTTGDECNDMLDCTMDRCDAMQCRNQVAPGSCLIGGRCVPDGEVNPEDPCERCEALTNPMGWTTSDVGAPCDDGRVCTRLDRCTAAGLCEGTAITCSGSTCAAGSCSEAEGGCILVPQNQGQRCGIGVCCNAGSCSMLCL